MNQGKVMAAILFGLSATVAPSLASAAGPFGRYSNRFSRPAQTSTGATNARVAGANAKTPSLVQGIMRSPERMTAVYGPSILEKHSSESDSVARQP